MPRITFLPFNLVVEASDGESIFEAARRVQLLLPTACVGKGTCGLCRVKIVSGEAHLPPPSPVEIRHLGNTYFITKLRLSCQLRPSGDVVVQIPDAPRKR